MAGIGIYLITKKKTEASPANSATLVKPKEIKQFGHYDENGVWIPQKITLIR